MFGIDFSEILVIFVIALVVLGPEKLPKLAATIGKWLGRARSMARQFREQLEHEASRVQNSVDINGHRPAPPPPYPPPPSAPPYPGHGSYSAEEHSGAPAESVPAAAADATAHALADAGLPDSAASAPVSARPAAAPLSPE